MIFVSGVRSETGSDRNMKIMYGVIPVLVVFVIVLGIRYVTYLFIHYILSTILVSVKYQIIFSWDYLKVYLACMYVIIVITQNRWYIVYKMTCPPNRPTVRHIFESPTQADELLNPNG